MNIIDSLRWRYATKKFDDNRLLPLAKLDVLKEAFNLTATSFGLQTIKMLIIENKSLRESLVKYAYGQKQVLQASHLLILCVDDNILDMDIDTHYDNVINIRNTPKTILEPFKADLMAMMKKMTQAERQQWSIKQAYIALGNLMTVCAVEGIDACPMEGFDKTQFDEALNLADKKLKSILLLPVGYRDDNDMFAALSKVRKPLNDTIIEM